MIEYISIQPNFTMKNRLTFKIISLLIFSDILETFIQFCFKKAALAGIDSRIFTVTDTFIFVKNVAASGFLWLGMLSVLIVFVIWSSVLSRIDLSVAVPIASFSYILIPITSIIFLGETVPLWRWIGIFFILLGVIIVSKSSQKDRSALE